MSAYLAFSNDTEYLTWQAYKEVHHILREELGTDVEDSFWLFDPEGTDTALFKGSLSEKGKYHDELLQEISEGRMTILHSAGFFTNFHTEERPCRELIHAGLEYLSRHARIPKIWTNHGGEGDYTNIGGAKRTYQQGDDPSSNCYILDLLIHYGFEYYWTDIDSTNAFVSTRHDGMQPLISEVTTDAGFRIKTFRRYRGALPKAPDAQTLCLQLSDENLEALAQSDGATVIYQHWGVHRDDSGEPYSAASPVFPAESIQSIRRLGRYIHDGSIELKPLFDVLEMFNQGG
jgi:hypothetical protein